jgi:hypothetical protein
MRCFPIPPIPPPPSIFSFVSSSMGEEVGGEIG